MNFLAHIYLSGDNDLITIGNFMADGIKGKRYKKYPIEIQKGILLHREIDTFTDAHPIVKQSTKRLHENYGHYSGVIVDILYDHFLASNWRDYHDQPLATYVDNFYQLLNTHFEVLTPRVQRMVPYMIADNWLLSYAKIEGIATVLFNMNRRTKYVSGMDKATRELELYYKEFEAEFKNFFEELQLHCKQVLSHLKSLEAG
ncbi:acyl carrier protein phosphodiesterase [Croceiramulus getboli]|nr:acyl carrier protein phosphodiesterase [Flavobacteriaceae bacterium YJPT1-3]